MAKITDLLLAQALAGDEALPLVQGAATRRVSLASLVAYMAPRLPQWIKGDRGETGPSNNTRTSLAALKGAVATDLTSLYDGSLWSWVPGNFTGRADDHVIVGSAHEPLTAGAWVRRSSSRAVYSVADFGGVGDGVNDDQPAIQRTLNFAEARGGGTVLLPAGRWLAGRPIEMVSGVDFLGESGRTVLMKLNDAVSDTTGVDCVICANGKSRFRIENIEVIGNRRLVNGQMRASARGFYLAFCSYFQVNTTRADFCLNGYDFNQCFTFSATGGVALRCQSSAYVLRNACTSYTLTTVGSWGCGGGWSINGCAYGTVNGAFCDLSDAGGSPDDPFGGESGGNYRDPAFVWHLSGVEGLAINGGGCELSWSQFLYAEGAQVVFNGPAISGMRADSADWRLMQLRGTGYSNVVINAPRGFHDVTPLRAGPSAILVENPAVQKLIIQGRWRPNQLTGISARGVIDPTADKLLDFTPTRMSIGASPFIKPDAADIATVVIQGAAKKLRFKAASAPVVDFTLPLPAEGMFLVRASADYASQTAGANIAIVETNGSTTNVLAQWSNDGGHVEIGEWLYRAAQPGYAMAFRIRTNDRTDELAFTNLEIVHVGGQA